MFDVLEHLALDLPRWLSEEVPVKGDHLRDIGDRVLRQARQLGGNEDVPRSVQQAKVGGEDDGHHRPDSAAVEGVVLHDEERASETGFGPARLIEVGPPDLAALDHHASDSSERRWARRTAGARRSGWAA